MMKRISQGRTNFSGADREHNMDIITLFVYQTLWSH